MGKPRWKKLVETPDRRHDLETPAPDWLIQQHAPTQPVNHIEALMMSTPGQPELEPETAPEKDCYENLDDILGVQLELNDIEKSVLDALFVAGLSIRDTADILGTSPSTVWRIKDSVMSRIIERANWATIGETNGTRDTGYVPDRGDEKQETGPVRLDPPNTIEKTG